MRPLLNFYPQLPLLIAKRAPRALFSSALFAIFTFSLLLTMALPALAQSDSEKSSEPELLPIAGSPIPNDLREAMILGKVTEGLEILDRLAEEKPERREDWLFFHASLLEQTNQSESALDLLRELESEYPKGRWFHRVRFMKARLLRDLGRFGEAQKIIEQETLRLHSEERRIELATLLIEEGDLLSAERTPGVVEEKPRDLLKAHAVYQQAAELNPPAPLLEKALLAMVRCSDAIGFPQQHMDFAYENGCDALALTDHGNCNGVAYQVLHAKKMQKEGKEFKPIYGCEAYFIPSFTEWQKVHEESKQTKRKNKHNKVSL